MHNQQIHSACNISRTVVGEASHYTMVVRKMLSVTLPGYISYMSQW